MRTRAGIAPALALVVPLLAGAALPAVAEEGAAAEAAKEGGVVREGSKVSLEYTLKLDDGSTADSNVGGEALVYEHGGEQILPALEKELAGLEVGATRHVELSAEQGYGVRRDDLVREVPIDRIPEDGRFAGARLMSQGPTGQPIVAQVVSVTETSAMVDLNHPLAGQTLIFDVKILAID